MTSIDDIHQAALPLPYDPTAGVPLPVLPLNERQALGSVPVRQLLDLVPDPIASENRSRVMSDPKLAQYAELRAEVQRLVEGAKAKNALSYGRYIVRGLKGEHPWITPPITLYHEAPLQLIRFAGGLTALLIPFGEYLVAIDGETQRIALQYAAVEYPPVLDLRVGVVIHHGKPVTEAKQGFYDLNTREVKPNAAVAISMDTLDPATKLTRTVIDSSEVLAGRVHLRRRQLRSSDKEVLTISALRSGIVTTILGAPGLQVGSRSLTLPEGTNEDALEAAVVEVWSAILEQLEDLLDPEARAAHVISSPSVLAAIGVVAHHAMPAPPRRGETPEWTTETVLDRLDGVNWRRANTDGSFPWDGIAGKVTPKGSFSIGGPKEVGYTVAVALEDPTSAGGQQIRRALLET